MKDNRLEQRIQHSLNAELSGLNTTSWQRDQFYENATGGTKVKRKLTYSLVLAIVLLLIAATALAYTVITTVFSPRVDAYNIANRALEEKYGVNSSMLGFFSRDSLGNNEHRFTVIYVPQFEDALAAKLGSYRVVVSDEIVESVSWSLDGISTEGGFDADAWGAEQLAEMVHIVSVTNNTSRFAKKASGEDIDLYADMERTPDGDAEDVFPEVDLQIEKEMALYRREVEEAGRSSEAQSRFTRDELIKLGRQGIIEAYHLDAEQQQRLTFYDTDYFIAYYSTIGIDNRPTFNMNFQSWSEDGWQEGDGVYTVVVNVLDGTIEYLEYDTTLAGNG